MLASCGTAERPGSGTSTQFLVDSVTYIVVMYTEFLGNRSNLTSLLVNCKWINSFKQWMKNKSYLKYNNDIELNKLLDLLIMKSYLILKSIL